MRILQADQAVLDHVGARADVLVTRAVAWADINSGSRNAEGLNRVLDRLEAAATALPSSRCAVMRPLSGRSAGCR